MCSAGRNPRVILKGDYVMSQYIADSIHDHLLDAMLDGQIGSGLIVTRQEVMSFFDNVNKSYTGVMLSNAEMETSDHSPTWRKYTRRIGKGTYRIHPIALANRLRSRRKVEQ